MPGFLKRSLCVCVFVCVCVIHAMHKHTLIPKPINGVHYKENKQAGMFIKSFTCQKLLMRNICQSLPLPNIHTTW